MVYGHSYYVWYKFTKADLVLYNLHLFWLTFVVKMQNKLNKIFSGIISV